MESIIQKNVCFRSINVIFVDWYRTCCKRWKSRNLCKCIKYYWVYCWELKWDFEKAVSFGLIAFYLWWIARNKILKNFQANIQVSVYPIEGLKCFGKYIIIISKYCLPTFWFYVVCRRRRDKWLSKEKCYILNWYFHFPCNLYCLQ